MFGSTARRVITKNTSRRDSELTSESESDGWYIDAPVAWLNLDRPPEQGAFCVFHALVGSGGNKRDDFRFNQNGERETGFPVIVVTAETHEIIISEMPTGVQLYSASSGLLKIYLKACTGMTSATSSALLA